MFRYVQERLSRNGSPERLTQEFPLSEIVIGRGGKSNIILTSREVALEHVVLKSEGGKHSLEDLKSLSGVRVNGKRVQVASLSAGDTIQLADVEFHVEISGEDLSLVHKISSEPIKSASQRAQQVADTLQRLQIDTYLPSMRVVSYVGLALVIACWYLWPLVSGGFALWNSGPISSSHSLISHDCLSCHALPFAHVRDADCQACHAMSEHSSGMSQVAAHHPEKTFRCAQCHMEHNGDLGVISRDARFCTGCHANLGQIEDAPKVLDVRDLDTHPQFRVSVRDGSGKKRRVPLDDQENARDQTPIKLNHAVHLKQDLRGPEGPVTLECNSCHQLDKDLRVFKPIEFADHCADCHRLGFDERLPDSEVPHAAPDEVYATLFTEYTKLLLMNASPPLTKTLKEGEREMPRGTRGTSAESVAAVDTTLVRASARDAELQLFTKTACVGCHEVTEKPIAERTDDGSRYRVTPVTIPTTWFPAARFSHGAHEPFTCESCHVDVRESERTSDLLLPPIANCKECHSQAEHPGFVTSECALCHSYHDSKSLPDRDKRDVTEYLRLLTR